MVILNAFLITPSPATFSPTYKFRVPSPSFQGMLSPAISRRRKPEHSKSGVFVPDGSYPPSLEQIAFQKSVILFAASLSVVLWSNPVHAGILSGFSGIESVPGPELPQIDFLSRFNEENQKRYAENDARFKESPLLKKLLEKTELNKEKNRQQTFDKYCARGAEWGVGDCSADGMSADDREKFISMLKQKAGIE